jgi:23S rRNA (adenine1618-N6)-methyltransferase
MPPLKIEHPLLKTELHPRSKHRERYNFKALIASIPQLAPHVKLNEFSDQSIDFSDPKAVLLLNKALLKLHYGINDWNIPNGYLCPPIPGRAEYLHNMADLLGSCHQGIIPKGNSIKGLDIGVGANCIYPIIGISDYNWSFVGTDIDPISIQSANLIINSNHNLEGKITLRLQANSKHIFKGVINEGDGFDLSICNPPFHASKIEAQKANLQKWRKLQLKNRKLPKYNFGGNESELWCEGGEEKFIETMIIESKEYARNCFWFSVLVSKQSHLKGVYQCLKKNRVFDYKTIPLNHGNKKSRIVAWTFLNPLEQSKWMLKW